VLDCPAVTEATNDDDRAVEAAVLAAADATGVPYEALPCDPDFADTAAFCERYGIDPADSANTIVVVGKGEPRRYVACVVLATTRLDVNGAVRKRLGVRRTSFAGADETRELTGMLIGGVTALALPPDLPLWVDEQVMARPTVVLGGGSRSPIRTSVVRRTRRGRKRQTFEESRRALRTSVVGRTRRVRNRQTLEEGVGLGGS
jgi:prolyl-tRNA editing enzyme YbaK/EbsC (Cys-tRNA(Pro) deacylase)